jgi:beta-lactamase regulating signal transducer with metallopeptidase domain
MEALSMRLLPLFDWLLWTTVQAALLFCLILLVQLVLRSRLPIRWHYCLWLLLLIRLAIPWLPESRISVFNLVPRSMQQGRILESYSKPQSAHGMGFYRHFESKGLAEQQQQEDPKTFLIRLVRMMPLLWLFGTVVLAVYVGAGNFRLWWLVTRERPLTDQKILDLLEDCKSEMGVRTILGVVMTDKVKSPALFGFLRPRLLLPAGMIETLSRDELRYVFLHELGHLRRRDIYVGWLMSFLQVLHWFNPLVWLAFYRMQTDRELACDALVLTCTRSGESKEYGRTIVNLLERFSRPQRLPSMAGILETKSQLKRRIKMIADYKKTSRTRWAGAMLLLAVLACVVLTNAYVAKADFEFSEPVNLESVIPILDPVHDVINCFSSDGLQMYIMSENWPGGYGDFDLWVLRRASKDDDWGLRENLGPGINSAKSDGNASISADELTLYFESDRPGGYGSYDIWMTTRATRDTPWTQPVNLGPKINSSVGDASPWISTDGLELFFTSFRADGYGRGDIYVAKRVTKDEPWGEPENLGPIVNSAYTEVFPCLSPDGLLLFFSDGLDETPRPSGYGGADMWVTRRASLSDPWQTPVNLGPRVNRSIQELAPRISPDGSKLYFFTNSDGTWDNWQVSISPVIDLNGDGKVDLKDFRKLAQYWGQNEPSCDIAPLPNGDGIVDEKDLNLLAEYLLKELQPVAHWKLDETEGNIAEDSISSDDGTLNGNPVWQPAGGAVGGALQLDGVGDYISTAFGLDPTKGSFSAFAWIKGGAPGQVIICQTGGTDNDTRWLWADPSYGRLMTWLMHPTYDPLVSESIITDGQWHHVGLVYDLESFCRRLYVDGVEVAKDNSIVGGEPSDGGLYFGADKRLGQGTFFSGLIDDVRIYDEVLSAEEVAELAR